MQTEAAATEALAEHAADASASRDLWSIPDFCRRHSISRSTVYDLLAEQRLDGVKQGRKTLITDESRKRWRATLPRVQVGGAAA